MPPKRLIAAASKQARADARSHVGPLSELLVSQKTLDVRYRPACRRFFESIASQSSVLATTDIGIDAQIAAYIENLWEEGEGRNSAGDIISAMSLFCPHLKGSLCCSWQLFKAWAKQEMPARAPPMPELWVLAAVALAQRKGWDDVGLVIGVAFYGLLRTTEACSLLIRSCSQTHRDHKWVLELGLTKGGLRRGALETVVVTDPLCGALLRRAKAQLQDDDLLLRRSIVKFRDHFRTLMVELGLAEFNLHPYSLRRGGATHTFRQCGSYDTVAELGRWSQATTAKVYINEGLANLNELKLSAGHATTLKSLADNLLSKHGLPPLLLPD